MQGCPEAKHGRSVLATIIDGDLHMRARFAMVLVLASTMVADCATSSSGASEGRQSIRVSAEQYPNPGNTTPTTGWGSGTYAGPQPIVGARCIVSNDRGSWSVTTPGSVEVESSMPLFLSPYFKVTCQHEGFKEESQMVQCFSLGSLATAAGASVGLTLGAVAGLAAIPAGPAVIVASVAGPTILGGAAGHALAGPKPGCTLAFRMTPTR